MIEFKEGVDILGVSNEILLGIMALESVFWRHGIPFCITSCRDGMHKEGSKHYLGDAVDVRLPSRYSNIANVDIALLNEGRAALNAQFTLLLEADHMHLQFSAIKQDGNA